MSQKAEVTGLNELIERFARGKLSRRELVRGLVVLAAAPAASLVTQAGVAAQSASTPIVRVRSINHVHFDVSDLKRSADFYAVMFGAKVRDQNVNFWTMTLPTGTGRDAFWFSLNKAPLPKPSADGGGLKPGHYSHMGIGVEIADPEATKRISEVMKQRFPFTNPRPTGPWNEKSEFPGSRSIYFTDPDGLIIQLIRPEDDGYLFPGSRDPQAPKWSPPTEKPLARVRSINHMHFDVSDLQRSADFYGALFGAKVHEKARTFWTMTLPTNTPGRAHWLSLSKAPLEKPNPIDGSGVKPGQYSHMGIGIDIPDPQATRRFAAAINKRFPFADAKPTGPWNNKGEHPDARSIYMRDPDGLLLQLIRPEDDGYLTAQIRGTGVDK